MAAKFYSPPALSFVRIDAQFVCKHEPQYHLQKRILMSLKQKIIGVLK